MLVDIRIVGPLYGRGRVAGQNGLIDMVIGHVDRQSVAMQPERSLAEVDIALVDADALLFQVGRLVGLDGHGFVPVGGKPVRQPRQTEQGEDNQA